MTQFGDVTYFRILIPSLVNVYILGPVALSVSFLMALAVPVRLVMQIKIESKNWLHLIWLTAFSLSIFGLYLAKSKGIESAGGLTIGLRIVLSIGALLIPLGTNKNHLAEQLILIAKISMILFFAGAMNSHWVFVTAAFPPFIYYASKNLIWKVAAIICALIFVIYGGTFTIRGTTIICWLLIMLLENMKTIVAFLRLKLFRITLFLLPLGIAYYVVQTISGIHISNKNTLTDQFIFKVFEDRGDIWKQTIDFIGKSDFFIVPAGRDILLNGYGIIGDIKWGAGAHNIYLEMARQLGVFSALLLSIIIFWYLFHIIGQLFKVDIISKFILVILSVYIVYGLSGNSLIYDGVGFLFWLIVGQIYNIGKIKYPLKNKPPKKIQTNKSNFALSYSRFQDKGLAEKL